MKKRIIVVALAIALVLAMIPVAALADGTVTTQVFHERVVALGYWVNIDTKTTYQSTSEQGGTISDNRWALSSLWSQGSWTFTASEKTGYEFVGWTYSGPSGAFSVSGKTLTITYKGNSQNYNATAEFRYLPRYTLTANAGAGGSITKNPDTATYPRGTSVTLTAVPGNGYRFVSWTGDASGTNKTTSITMDGNKTVGAVFELLPTYTVDVSVTPGGTGTVTKNPDVAAYWEGRNVTLTAAANAGWRFSHWSGSVTGTANPITFAVNSSMNVTANFVKTYNITLSTQGNGDLDHESRVEGTRDAGTVIHLNDADPDPDAFWSFLGWRDNDTGELLSSDTFTLDRDRSFTAVFTDTEYLTVYAWTNGYLAHDISGHYGRGAVINLNDAQPKGYTGYTFDKWQEFNSGWEDVTLQGGQPIITIGDWNYFRAVFKVATYTVSFEENGGSTVADQTVTHGYKATKPADPTRTGYDFAGWYKNSGLTTPFDFNTAITANTAIYAKWTAHSYTVNYDGNGSDGGSTASSSHTYDISSALTVNGFTRTGYTFAGWATAGTGDVVYGNNASVLNLTAAKNGSVTLFAKWTANGYTVAYNGNGATDGSTSSSSHTFGVSSALTANGFTRTGYTFAGWAATDTGDVVYGDGAAVLNLTHVNGGTVTLFAKWTANSYTVNYNGNGATGGNTASSSHTYDVSTTLTANGFTRTGYTFAGWAATDTGDVVYGDGAAVLNLTNVNSGTVTLFAKWTANSYTVAYDGNGATGGDTASSSHTYDVSTTLTANGFTRTGYTFAGWAATDTGDVVYGDGAAVLNLTHVNSGTVTLFAKWTANSYTVAYDGNGATDGDTASSSHTYDISTALTANGFTRTGYTFAGWAATAAGDAIYGDEADVLNLASENGSTVTLFAKWTANGYTVSYNGNGATGGDTASSSHTYDVSAALSTNGFTKDGHTFAGWAATETGSVEYADGANVLNLTADRNGTVTLFAKWTIHTFTVSFVDYDGTPLGTQTVNWNTAATAPEEPGRTGFYFAGWDKDFSAVKENMTVTAQYTRSLYTVRFVDYDGTVLDTQSVAWNRGAGAPADPEREGYTFTGWDTAFDPVRSNLVVTALYSINTYTVTFMDYDGTVLDTQTVDWNTSAVAPADPSREGFEFSGWDASYDGVKSNLTITAQYKAVTVIEDEEVPDTDGSAVDDEAVPTVGGAGFAWWWILIIAAGVTVLFFLIFFVARRRKDEQKQQ